jgi:hypothetical protein
MLEITVKVKLYWMQVEKIINFSVFTMFYDLVYFYWLVKVGQTKEKSWKMKKLGKTLMFSETFCWLGFTLSMYTLVNKKFEKLPIWDLAFQPFMENKTEKNKKIRKKIAKNQQKMFWTWNQSQFV